MADSPTSLPPLSPMNLPPLRSSNSMTEHLIGLTVDFFSKMEHQCERAIEGTFLPMILCYSQKLNAGKTLDASVFRDRLTSDRLDYCYRIFSEAKTLKLSTQRIMSHDILSYIAQFQNAKELFISVYDDDIFNPLSKKLTLTSINIQCSQRGLWNDPVESILSNNLPLIDSFSLVGGYLGPNGLLSLLPCEFKKFELHNIHLYNETDRNSLKRMLKRNKNLEVLKLVNLGCRSSLNSFNGFFEDFQTMISEPLSKLKTLSFSLRQDLSQENYLFNLFPNLLNLEIYYTSEREYNSLSSLITTLNDCRVTRTCNPARITFIEYLITPLETLDRLQRNNLRIHSGDYKRQIIDQNHKYVDVLSRTSDI